MAIILLEDKGKDLIKNIHDGIIKKLRSAKQLVNFDKEISAGLYTYALEEFGKLLLVKGSKLKTYQYEIKHEWFRTHKDKFPKAFDYLQENNHGQCIAIAEGDYNPNDFYWRDFMIGLPANFKARLSIFYCDFKIKGSDDIEILEATNVDKNMLQNAIDELEKAVKEIP